MAEQALKRHWHKYGSEGLPECRICGKPPEDSIHVDPTAQTEPLTVGQQIADWYEGDIISVPADLAERIDDALDALASAFRANI